MYKNDLVCILEEDISKCCLESDFIHCVDKDCFACLASFLIQLGYRKTLDKESNVSKD